MKVQIKVSNQDTRSLIWDRFSAAAPYNKWQFDRVEDYKMTILIDLPSDVRGNPPGVEKDIAGGGFCLLRFSSTSPTPEKQEDDGDYMIQ